MNMEVSYLYYCRRSFCNKHIRANYSYHLPEREEGRVIRKWYWESWTQKMDATSGHTIQRGYCIRSPLVTKHFEVVILHEDITQRDLKNSRPWYICDISSHLVLAMSVNYFWRYEYFSERQRHLLALRLYSYQYRWLWARLAKYYIK